MSIRSLIISLTVIVGLSSCGGDNTPVSVNKKKAEFTVPSSITPSPVANQAGEVSFNATTIQVPAGSKAQYIWDFGDNTTVVTSDVGFQKHEYSSNGNYTVKLTVIDLENKVDSVEITIPVVISNMSQSTFSVDVGYMADTQNPLLVTFTPSVANLVNTPATYAWDFGDGNSTTSQSPMHTYAADGTYSVTLTVTDGLQKSVSASKPIMVAASGKTKDSLIAQAISSFIATPCANCHYPDGPAINSKLHFKLSASSDLTAYSVENGLIDWIEKGGVVNRDNPVTGGTVDHSNQFNVMPVTEQANTQLWNDLVDVMVQYVKDSQLLNKKPDAVILVVDSGNNTFAFDASSSSDADNDSLTYSWDFGDNSPASTAVNPTHVFADGMDFTVTLTVFDGVDNDQAVVEVSTKAKIVGDPVAGATLYQQHCHACHQDEGIGGTHPTYGITHPFVINKYLDNPSQLLTVIDQTMPKGNANMCIGQCATDVQAFMLTWQRQTIAAECTKPDSETKYGSRQLKLLTVSEYANSVKDILGFDVDQTKLSANVKVYEFDNNAKTAVDFSRLQGYQAAAESISKALYASKFDTVVGMENCVDDGDCADKFSGEALTRLFRREVTPAEAAEYVSLFNNGAYSTGTDIRDGMKLAVRTALMSPNFLYRSELGMTKAEYEAYNAEISKPVPWVSTDFTGSDFKQYGQPLAGANNDSVGAYQTADVTYSFTGNDLIKVNLTAPSPGHNSASISVGDTELWSGTTDVMTEIEVTYTGDAGSLPLKIKAGNTNATIGDVKIGKAPVVPTLLVVPDIAPGTYALTSSEMATYLAYSYTGSTPDDALIAAATANDLATDAQIKAQIERLLATDKAKVHFGEFAAQWFTTDAVLKANKDGFPAYTDAVKAAMAQEIREIFKDVMFDDSVPFSAIYDSNHTFVNQILADFYGIGGVTGSDFVKVAAPTRGGIVTSGALLSAWTAPTESKLILRGVRIRERLLCQHFPPFPSNVDLGEIRDQQQAIVDAKKAEEDGKIRQAHLDYINTDVVACKSCHEYIINPLGVGLEDFDAVGLPRTTYGDNGLSINFTGFEEQKETHQSALYGITNVDDSSERVAFQGAKELGQILGTGAAADVARSCMIEMGFRFMVGSGTEAFSFENATNALTDEEKVDYTCTAESMLGALNTSNSPKDAFINLGLSDIVRYRKQYIR